MAMEVILRQAVENLGHPGDIVTVSPGYARNYLLPRKLALAVTPGNRRIVESERQKAEARELEERQQAEAFATRIGQLELSIARRVGETDHLYGSVTTADLAEALAVKGLDVDRRKIQLDEPIKTLGEFSVPVKLHRDVTAALKVAVVKQE